MNYLAKFLPRLSDETEVLRKLTERDAEWCWLPAHADALARVKEMIVTAPVLAYYDVSSQQSDLELPCCKKGVQWLTAHV